MKLKPSLNQKLVVPIVFAYLLVVILLVVSEYQTSKKESMAFLKERIVQLSNVVQYGTISLMLQNKCDGVPDFLQKSSATIRSEVAIFDPRTGLRLFSTDASDNDAGWRDPDFDRYPAHQESAPMVLSEHGEPHLIRFLPLENGESCQACHRSRSTLLGVIKVKQALTPFLREARDNMIKLIVISTIGITLFALIFSYVVMRLINQPLRKIMQAIHRIEEGDLDCRVSIGRSDIIGELAEKINAMTKKRKEAAIELQRCHDLQVMKASQMASIGEMAACIAHDIKNPLACMSGALQVIDAEMLAEDENKPIIKEVIEQIGRIDHSVKKILHYAKPGAEPVSVVDLDEILAHTLSLIDKYAGQKNIAVAFARGAGEKKISGGHEALQQLFFNVCLNGIESMEGPGSLSVASNLLERGVANRDGVWVEVDIRDTGCGIDDRDRGLIFKPLFTTKATGTGLGLSISAEIVERYNGFTEVASVLGQGTRFKIYFPVTTA